MVRCKMQQYWSNRSDATFAWPGLELETFGGSLLWKHFWQEEVWPTNLLQKSEIVKEMTAWQRAAIKVQCRKLKASAWKKEFRQVFSLSKKWMLLLYKYQRKTCASILVKSIWEHITILFWWVLIHTIWVVSCLQWEVTKKYTFAN